MQIRCLQEVYFQPKMFETIGFHHQGNYNITAKVYHINPSSKHKTYAYPILPTHKYPTDYDQQSEHDKISDRLTYHTQKFDVSFNQQEFLFSGGCRFKFQFQTPQIMANGNSCLYLLLELIKYNAVETKGDLKFMTSTQNIIKNNLDNHKDSSSQKIVGLSQQNSSKNINKKNIKIWQKVCDVALIIDTSEDKIKTTTSMYQAIVFPNQQYFGKLFFMVNHATIGYKFRANGQMNLRNYVNMRQAMHQGGKVPNKQHGSYSKQQKKRVLIQKLHQSFENVCTCFNEMIKKQVNQFHAISQMETVLFQEPEHQYFTRYQARTSYSSNRISKSSTNNYFQNNKSFTQKNTMRSNKKQLVNIMISQPPPQISDHPQNLLSYYQCHDFNELYFVIYEESVNLASAIMLKWLNLIFLMSQQKWCSSYFHKTLRNLKEQTEYLIQNQVTNELQLDPIPKNIQPKLKYKFYIHESLPEFFIRKQRAATKPPIGITSEHILFVLVHGFNGNQFDMNRIKSFISYFCSPHYLVLRNISGRAMEDLDTIGKIAAEEIIQFVKLRPFIKRINFIGFSLGGLIIRACLTYLKEYHKLFNLLITLSSPHLGVKQVKNCIVKTGMQVLQKFRGAKNIKQLFLDFTSEPSEKIQKMVEDERNEQEDADLCYLQKLSKDPSLKKFNLILMCGSQEDKYVPGFSATLDYRGDSQRLIKMQRNMKRNINNLHQIFVRFSSKKTGTIWDRITGRRVHINFLDDDSFLYFLLAQYFHIF